MIAEMLLMSRTEERKQPQYIACFWLKNECVSSWFLTCVSRVACGAVAAVSTDVVDAGSTILAGVRCTVIYVGFTVSSLIPSSSAVTSVTVGSIIAHSILAGVRCTVVYVGFTRQTIKPSPSAVAKVTASFV